MKRKIIKITAIITLLVMVISMFSSCKSSDTNKPSEMLPADTQEVETIPEHLKDLQYYEKLAETSRPKIKYDGTYLLGHKPFNRGITVKDLQKEFPVLEGVKDKQLGSLTTYSLTCGYWDGETSVEIYNNTNKSASYYDCQVISVYFPVTKNTKLYDLIGEQLVAIPEGYNFVESVFYVFGSPQALDKDKKTIDVTYVLLDPNTSNPQKEIWINFVFDNNAEKGYFKIMFE